MKNISSLTAITKRGYIFWPILISVFIIVTILITAVIVKAQPKQPPGIPARAPAVRGSGTPNFIPLWIATSTLGNAPAKTDANNNLIMAPGTSLYILSPDGTKCLQLTGETMTFLHKVGIPCPSF